jgi:lipoprotein-anchoring transpeptidase ErfK/SrfK
VAADDTCGRYGLRSSYVRRRVLIASVVVAWSAIAAAVTVPNRAAAGSTDTVRIESVFPAAGELTVNSVPVRKTPSPGGRVIKVMHSFRPDYRPQEIFAVRKTLGSDGQTWYRISIPMRPNGTYGWIPARTVSLSPTHNQIVVNLNSRTIDLYAFGRRKWHGKVAIGAPGRETPVGHYYVAARFVPYHDAFLGVFAVETSAYSKLTEWPGGGVVGIHGTSLPQLLGQAVSHGCVRVSNQTAAKMKSLAPLGTPIWIKK